MFNVVLVEPEIPANTGNIGRTCVVTGSRLHLVEPIGFSLDDKMLHRAGLGYWNSLDLVVHDSWQAFLDYCGFSVGDPNPRLHLLTKKAKKVYSTASYNDGDFLVFGKESDGLPEEVLAEFPENCERIPMLADEFTIRDRESWGESFEEAHSGNAASDNADSPIRQQDICGNFIDPDDYKISALNLSNAAAIVLYEALRQTGFEGMPS
ncbi:MAG: tRNA (cytidine(34)-2'-O)-methyltransferase [Coriobacteriales bacterium]|jgi:tRNA (cytidine/uridine-2'-O-)-methyltransferase